MNEYRKKVSEKLYSKNLGNMHSTESKNITATKLLNNEVLEKFRGYNCKTVLDAGCGEGRFLEMADSRGFKVKGFDKNSDLVKLCRSKKLDVSKGDMEQKLPYEDGSFDGIYCTNVLEHTTDPAFSLYEFRRILKPGGLLILAVPEFSKSFYDDWTHMRPFTKVTLERLAKSVGFRKFSVKRRHFPFLTDYWKNPFVRLLNTLGSKGISGQIFTKLIELSFKVHRHDLVLEAVKQ